MAGRLGDAQSQQVEELLAELSNKMERLKILYEQYFMGIEKIEPQVARKEVTRAVLSLQQQHIRNTGLRFRFNTMLQKWNMYVTYWNRTLREIENGTYVRHLQRAKRAAEREGKDLPDEMKNGRLRLGTVELPEEDTDPGAAPPGAMPAPAAPTRHAGEPTSRAPEPASRPAARPPPLPPGARPPPPTAAAPRAGVPGMSDSELRALHRKYAEARAANGEGQVRYEALVESLARQVPRVLEQHGAKAVRFDVAVQNGKAVLKAIPEK